MSELRINNTAEILPNYRPQDKEDQEKASIAAGAAQLSANSLSSFQSVAPVQLPVEAVNNIDAPSKPGFLSRVLAKIANYISPENDEAAALSANQQVCAQGVQLDYIRPELDKPSPFAADTLKQLVAKAVDGSGKRITEAELEKLILAANKKQVESYEEEIRSQMDDTLQKIRENESLKDKYLELRKEAEEKQKASTIFNWTTISTGIIGGALAIGGIIAAVFSGGAAIPIVLGVGAAIAAISGGATQIAGGVFKYQGDKHQGDALRTREERGMNKDSIQIILQDVETKENSIIRFWNNARSVVSNQPHMFDGSDGN